VLCSDGQRVNLVQMISLALELAHCLAGNLWAVSAQFEQPIFTGMDGSMRKPLHHHSGKSHSEASIRVKQSPRASDGP